jgi:hypothetical protein
MNRSPIRILRIVFIVVGILFLVLVALAEFVVTDTVPNKWRFHNLPSWAQYSVIVLAFVWFIGQFFPAIPPRRARMEHESDDFKCVHCGALIHSVDTACQKCGWTWTAK